MTGGWRRCLSGDVFDSHILLEDVVHDCNRVMIQRRKKGCDSVTIDELKAALDRIPKTGAINRARRNAILAQIYALMGVKS